jgi:hypothetical protein
LINLLATAVRASLAARRLTKINGKADEAARINEKKSEENAKASGEKRMFLFFQLNLLFSN